VASHPVLLPDPDLIWQLYNERSGLANIMQAQQVLSSPEAYFDLEATSTERHEYRDGEILLMPGGLPNHNQIALNLGGSLNFGLKRQAYQVFVADQRLWIPLKRIYTYPDVMLLPLPLELQPGRRDTVMNPLTIAEVLSESTRDYDRDSKFSAYRTLPSLQEYILIDQYSVHVEQYVKANHDQWLYRSLESPQDVLEFATINFAVPLIDIYDKVHFE
jgi:Uma2 family endonuclease